MDGAVELEEWRNKMRSMTSEFIEVDDALKTTSKDLAPLRKRKKALQEDILASMIRAGVDACNITGRDDKLLVKTRKKKTPLKDVLPDRLLQFFGGDGEKAEACMRVIMEPHVEEVKALARVSKRKRKAAESAEEEEPPAPEEEDNPVEDEEEEEEDDS